MNILVLSHLFPSPGLPDSGLFVKQQLSYLSSLKHNITVVCPVPFLPSFIPSKRYSRHRKYTHYMQDNNIEIFFIRTPIVPKYLLWLRGILHFIFHFGFFIRLQKQKEFQLIHSHVILPGGQLGMLLKKLFKIPLVVTVHGADFQIYLNFHMNFKAIRAVCKYTDQITCVSEKLAAIYNSRIKKKQWSDIQVIPNGIEVEIAPTRKQYLKDSDEIKLVTIASLRKQKNLQNVFIAITKLVNKYSNLKYYVIGDGWDKEFFINKLGELGNPSSIKLLGHMDHTSAMTFLNDAQIFVLTSRDESFGIVYLEAMYLYKITIGSKNEGIDGIIIDGKNGYLLDPCDIDGLVEKIDFIIENYDQLGQIRENAHRTVWPKYSWESNAKEYNKLYERLI